MGRCAEPGCSFPHLAKGLCRKHYGVLYRTENAERYKLARKERYARDRDKELAAGRTRHLSDPSLKRATQRLWRAANVDTYLKAARRNNSKRRALKKQVSPAGVLGAESLRARPCACCGKPGPSAIDHILPLSWAAECDTVRECLGESWCYQPLCISCNSSKKDRGVWCFVPTGDVE